MHAAWFARTIMMLMLICLLLQYLANSQQFQSSVCCCCCCYFFSSFAAHTHTLIIIWLWCVCAFCPLPAPAVRPPSVSLGSFRFRFRSPPCRPMCFVFVNSRRSPSSNPSIHSLNLLLLLLLRQAHIFGPPHRQLSIPAAIKHPSSLYFCCCCCFWSYNMCVCVWCVCRQSASSSTLPPHISVPYNKTSTN